MVRSRSPRMMRGFDEDLIGHRGIPPCTVHDARVLWSLNYLRAAPRPAPWNDPTVGGVSFAERFLTRRFFGTGSVERCRRAGTETTRPRTIREARDPRAPRSARIAGAVPVRKDCLQPQVYATKPTRRRTQVNNCLKMGLRPVILTGYVVSALMAMTSCTTASRRWDCVAIMNAEGAIIGFKYNHLCDTQVPFGAHL